MPTISTYPEATYVPSLQRLRKFAFHKAGAQTMLDQREINARTGPVGFHVAKMIQYRSGHAAVARFRRSEALREEASKRR